MVFVRFLRLDEFKNENSVFTHLFELLISIGMHVHRKTELLIGRFLALTCSCLHTDGIYWWFIGIYWWCFFIGKRNDKVYYPFFLFLYIFFVFLLLFQLEIGHFQRRLALLRDFSKKKNWSFLNYFWQKNFLS